MTGIPRALVAEVLGVSPDALPEGDLPVARLAARYLGYLRDSYARDDTGAHPEFWTFVLLGELTSRLPQLALDVIVSALPLVETADELALACAGPLEDLLAAHGADVIARIEAEAASSARLRMALTAVAPEGSSGTALWRRVDAAAAGSPLLESDAPLPKA